MPGREIMLHQLRLLKQVDIKPEQFVGILCSLPLAT